MAPRILVLDIETSPNLAHVWGLFKQTVSLNQLMESGEVISFASKWYGEKRVEFHSTYDFKLSQVTDDAHKAMVDKAWELWNEADIVVHFNGTSFDMPHLRREFLRYKKTPPSPVQEIDLLTKGKSVFRFTSNKLDYVSKYVGLEGKVHHEGHGLWVKCLAGDPAAWRRMRAYNKFDVTLTEQYLDMIRPWLKGLPHMGLYSEEEHSCQRCGGTDFTRQGFAYTPLGKFQQYRCEACGSWSRGRKNLVSVDERGIQ